MQSVATASIHGDHLWAITYFCVPNHSSSTQHISYRVFTFLSMFGIKTYINPSCYRGGGGDASHEFVIGTHQLPVDPISG